MVLPKGSLKVLSIPPNLSGEMRRATCTPSSMSVSMTTPPGGEEGRGTTASEPDHAPPNSARKSPIGTAALTNVFVPSTALETPSRISA